MRAAAFSYGVLTGFDQTRVPTRTGPVSLLDRLDFLSGVSGGSILAAYYGLRGRAALGDFKQRFLRRQCRGSAADHPQPRQYRQGAGKAASTTPRRSRSGSTRICTITRRSSDLLSRPRPRVWINASDIYNRTAFIFAPVTFSALCSDLSSYPVSLAVAASAAVPVVFAPIVIQNYPGGCPVGLPSWVERVHNNPECPAADQILRRCARTLSLRRDQIRQAARRRPGRQLRACRLHHCAAGLEHARRSAGAAGSGQAAAFSVSGRRFRPRRRRASGRRPSPVRPASI